jgi:hypothetical protein
MRYDGASFGGVTSHLDAKLGVRKKRVGATRQQTEPDKIRAQELPPNPVGIIMFSDWVF